MVKIIHKYIFVQSVHPSSLTFFFGYVTTFFLYTRRNKAQNLFTYLKWSFLYAEICSKIRIRRQKFVPMTHKFFGVFNISITDCEPRIETGLCQYHILLFANHFQIYWCICLRCVQSSLVSAFSDATNLFGTVFYNKKKQKRTRLLSMDKKLSFKYLLKNKNSYKNFPPFRHRARNITDTSVICDLYQFETMPS